MNPVKFHFFKTLFLPFLGIFLCPPAWGTTLFPRPQGPINDYVGVLDATQKAQILSKVQEVKDKTGAEIFVAVVPSLKGMTVEQYTNRLFAQWGPGQKGKDDGLLVVVCPPEHKVRIEVGYGLEPIVTDAQAGDIIRQNFLPVFKKGQYGVGLLAGVGELAKKVEAGHQADVARPEIMDDFLNASFQTITTFGLCLFAFIGALFFGIGLGNKVLIPMLFGAVFAGAPLWMAFAIPIFNTALMYVLCTESAAFVLGFLVGRSSKGKGGWGKGGSMGGWKWGNWGGSSSGGGSSWGGGGSSGGGGASGSW